MSRTIIIVQQTGGVGKSTTTRALAEAVPDAPVIEIESTRRLLEIEGRVAFFPMRADRPEIAASAGEAALSEYDQPLNRILREPLPSIVDVGANSGVAVVQALGAMAEAFSRRGKEIGMVVVVANDASAYTDGAKLLALGRAFTAAQFVVANEVRGPVDGTLIKSFAKGRRPRGWCASVSSGAPCHLFRLWGSHSFPTSTKTTWLVDWPGQTASRIMRLPLAPKLRSTPLGSQRWRLYVLPQNG